MYFTLNSNNIKQAVNIVFFPSLQSLNNTPLPTPVIIHCTVCYLPDVVEKMNGEEAISIVTECYSGMTITRTQQKIQTQMSKDAK